MVGVIARTLLVVGMNTMVKVSTRILLVVGTNNGGSIGSNIDCGRDEQ